MNEWRKTGLSVEPGYYEMATGDVEPLQFKANEPITDVTTTVYDLTAGLLLLVDPSEDIVQTVTPNLSTGDVIVMVSGGVRGHLYELQVQFTNAGGRKWTRTLNVEFVA